MTAADRERVVLLTQTGAAATRLARPLAAAGVRVRDAPVVVSEPMADLRAVDEAIAMLASTDWVVFTSARAAAIVTGREAWRHRSWACEACPRIAVVGPATGEVVAASGAPVALCPARAGADELARALIDAGGGTLAGTTVVWPRSAIAGPVLRDALVAAHARVVDPIAYTTFAVVPAGIGDVARDIRAGKIDAVTFLSPSCADGLAAALGEGTLSMLAGRTVVASVGPTTTAALTRLGAPPAVEAADRTCRGLAAVLLRWFDSNKGDLP